MTRLLQIRSSNHHLLTAHVKCSLNNIFEVVTVGLFSMVDSSEDRVTEIDANLQDVSVIVSPVKIELRTSAYLNFASDDILQR